MLNPELLEVVHLLPTGAAKALHLTTPACQMYVCQYLKIVLDNWKEEKMVLDPIQFDAVVTVLVATGIEMYRLKRRADGAT